MKRPVLVLLCLFSCFRGDVWANGVETYVVKRSVDTIVTDGVLDEASWEHAVPTRAFVIYTDGSMPRYHTAARMMWDDRCLYIAMRMTDGEISATFENHDDALYKEDVAEIFIDPDGDGLNYIEIEVSPRETVLDLVMDREYAKGGKGDWDWDLDGFEAGVHVEGTLNDISDSDAYWVMECAIPFESIAFSSPGADFPPKPGDEWRLNLYRYEYNRNQDLVELSAWNMTGKGRGFHAPDMFGRLVFSGEPVYGVGVEREKSKPGDFAIVGSYPNPFNPSTTIVFSVPEESPVSIEVFNAVGQKVRGLFSGEIERGLHEASWDGMDDDGEPVTSGVYFVRLRSGGKAVSHRVVLVR